MKKVLSCLLIMSVLVGLCACSSSSDSSDSSSAADTSTSDETEEEVVTGLASYGYSIDDFVVEDTTVTLYHKLSAEGGAPESDYFIAAIDEWNAENNGITIETVFISTESEYFNRISTDIAAGEAPDIMLEYGGSDTLDYVEADILLDLTPYLEADEDWYNGFVSANWDRCDYSSFGIDGIYGVPWSAYEILLYYNEEHLAACGLEVPESWEDFVNCCEVLTENGYQPLLAGEGDNYYYEHLISTLAVKTYGPDFDDALAAREYTYESNEVLDLMYMITEIQDAGYLGENLMSFTVNESRAAFGAGESTFLIDLSRGGALLEGTDCYNEGTIHATKFPYVNEEYSAYSMGGASGSYFVSTMNKSDNQIMASLIVLKWLTSTEFVDGLVAEYANTYSVIPSDGIIDNYLFEECNVQMQYTEEYVGALSQVSTNTAEQTIVRSALQLLCGGTSVEDVANEIVTNLADYE